MTSTISSISVESGAVTCPVPPTITCPTPPVCTTPEPETPAPPPTTGPTVACPDPSEGIILLTT